VFVVVACAIFFCAVTLISMVAIFARRRVTRATSVEQPYVMAAEDATRFDERVTAIFAEDPEFASRCRELLDHGE
jgi:hypothetical protein